MEPGGKIPGYVVTGKLGSGSDSEVYECVKKHDSLARKVAVKAIRKDQTPERLERARKEIEVLELLDHPNIVKLQEWFETDDALYIVLERAGGGDLFEVLYSHELNPTQTVLEEKCARRIFTQTALAVSYMHRQGVCHRDLKPENIFLDSEWNVKVGDFGLSHRYQPGRKVNDPVGSLIYASPEVLRRESYVGPELDAWSMGILLYEMLCGTPPFVGETERDLCRAILAGEYSVPDFVSPGARSLISKLVKLKHYRISMEEVLNHPWIMEGLPAAIAVQRRSRKRRGSIMSASSEETSNSPKSRQAPKEARKKRKEGSTRKSRKDQEASITLVAPDAESSVPSVTAAAPVAPVVGDAELAQRDLMTISAGDLAVVRAAVTAQTKPQILNDEEELATGGTESPVVSGTLSPAVLASDLPNPSMSPPKKQQLCDDDEEAGALSGHLQKLDLSRESFPAYSKTASLRETLSVPVPPLRSLSSPVVQF